MKIKINLSLIILILSIIISMEIMSQESKCTYCTEDPAPPFSDTTSVALTQICEGRVIYKTRTCGGVQELKIVDVLGCDERATNPGFSIKFAIYELVLKNLMGFTAGEWHIIAPSCWKYQSIINNDDIQPCDTNTCCITQLKAVNNECSNLSITDVNHKGKPICTPSGPMICYYACDDMYKIFDLFQE